MKHICVIGSGYVGLVTGACLAELGNQVTCVDTDTEKIAVLCGGAIPFFEPGLEELVKRNSRTGRLHFSSNAAEALDGTEIIFIAVGTPMGDDGHADLQYVRAAALSIAKSLNSGSRKVIVNKSTVPVETGDLVASIIREHSPAAEGVSVVSNPEFLREGSAIFDFMQPDRIIIGVHDKASATVMRELYAPLYAPVIVTDVRTAEMIKYAANAFLATKISFINEIANICQEVGADVRDVVKGVGSDKRIGTAFMNPGLGFGGSCFPKDVTALSKFSEKVGVRPAILEAVLEVNRTQIERCVRRLEEQLGSLRNKRIAILGLSFKPNTDDVRESPAMYVTERLLERGATIAAHDPAALWAARGVLGERVTYCNDVYGALKEADAMFLATDWNEYKQLDLSAAAQIMRGRVIFDARNIYNPSDLVALGFSYIGIGRRAPLPVDRISVAK